MNVELPRNKFEIGNMATDLMNITIQICNKNEDKKTTRFPRLLYSSYVNLMVKTSIEIHADICNANEELHKSSERREYQKRAKAKLVHLTSLIAIAYENKWISEKQYTRWQGLATNLMWKVVKWSS